MLALILLLSLISGLKAQETSTTVPFGQLIEKLTCTRDPSQSYALYLPRNYDKSRKWPVLYAFDPGARQKPDREGGQLSKAIGCGCERCPP